MVVEPVHGSTGAVASDTFLGGLRSITKSYGSALIIDATDSACGATGKNFWGYNGHADYVVFGKRAFVEGYFSRTDSKMHSITFGGDPLRALQFRVLKDVIDSQKLIDRVNSVG